MGLLGLRKFVDASGCTRLLPMPLSDEELLELQQRRHKHHHTQQANGLAVDAAGQGCEGSTCAESDHDDEDGDKPPSSSPSLAPEADHVLIDMNCIVHSCFGTSDILSKDRKEIIRDVLERVRVLVTRVIVPSKSLSICFDGPAPIAKLQTQRLRRRKASLLDAGAAHRLTSLAITPGSLFLVDLENALAAQFKLRQGKGFLCRRCPVYLHGSTVVGEGEAKIARALTFLSAATAPTAGERAEVAEHSPRVPPYDPNDVVVLIGNDIDLTLTCLGATPYHNLSVVGPSSLQLINVSELLYRWLTASSATHGDAARITPRQLPSVRIDFMFLFLLNGGDHYVGAGEVAMPLWQRYRVVRAAYPNSSLVSRRLDALDTDFLADVLSASDYTGEAEVEVGMELLQSALWSLYTIVTGICPDYKYVPSCSNPHLSHLRAAAAHCAKTRRRVRLHYVEDSLPLSPLETFVALMPTEATWPKSVSTALRQSNQHSTARVLATSNRAEEIAQGAIEAVKAATPYLSKSEQYLRSFTQPVQLNVLPRRKRLSRNEQHRMMATKGAIVLEDPAPFVVPIEIPTADRCYSHVTYPSTTEHLIFSAPLDVGGRGGGRRVSLSEAKRAPSSKETPSAKLQRVLAEAAQSDGGQTSSKAPNALNKRLHKLQLQGQQMLREEARKEDAHHRLSQSEQQSFLSELQQFLGDDDSAELLLREAGKADASVYKGSTKHKRSRETVSKHHTPSHSSADEVRPSKLTRTKRR